MVTENGARYNWVAGDIKLSARTDPEPGWLKCDGTAYSIYDYVNLYSAIGFKYGGSGTMFKVPDTQRRVPVGAGGVGTDILGNALGNTGGAETHTLTIDEMPGHTHEVPKGPPPASGSAPDVKSTDGRGSGTTESTGGSEAHNNMQPSIIFNYFIKV